MHSMYCNLNSSKNTAKYCFFIAQEEYVCKQNGVLPRNPGLSAVVSSCLWAVEWTRSSHIRRPPSPYQLACHIPTQHRNTICCRTDRSSTHRLMKLGQDACKCHVLFDVSTSSLGNGGVKLTKTFWSNSNKIITESFSRTFN